MCKSHMISDDYCDRYMLVKSAHLLFCKFCIVLFFHCVLGGFCSGVFVNVYMVSNN